MIYRNKFVINKWFYLAFPYLAPANINYTKMEPQQEPVEPTTQPKQGLYNQFDAHAVEDEHVPAYYSQRTIWIFSIVFSVIFGAVLLILNIKERKGKLLVALYGIVYMVFMLVVLSKVERNTALTFAANALGGYILISFFWNKFIGKTPYSKKPFWKPLVVAIMITIPLVILAIYSMAHPEL
jgi:drug/metabolite transporter superfamily protein YnfA